MCATFSTVAPPRQCWHQSRKLRYGVALVALGVAGYFVLSLLLMPADLRRMQGTWKLVRAVHDGKEAAASGLGKIVVINGNRALSPDGRSNWFEIRPEQKTLVFYEPHSMKVFGVEFHLPVWLRRPHLRNTCRYYLGESSLVLYLGSDDPEVGNSFVQMVRVP